VDSEELADRQAPEAHQELVNFVEEEDSQELKDCQESKVPSVSEDPQEPEESQEPEASPKSETSEWIPQSFNIYRHADKYILNGYDSDGLNIDRYVSDSIEISACNPSDDIWDGYDHAGFGINNYTLEGAHWWDIADGVRDAIYAQLKLMTAKEHYLKPPLPFDAKAYCAWPILTL